MNKILLEKIKRRLDDSLPEMVRLQCDLTAIPALAPENGGDGESDKAAFLKKFLLSAGFSDVIDYPAPDSRVTSGNRPNLITVIPGNNRERTVWILTHLDVVPPGNLDLWDHNPYEGYVKDGKIFGRGTEDNQQDLVASLFAAKAFLDEGVRPENTVGLAFVSDEETGSNKGLKYLLETQRSLFRHTDLIVVPDSGSSDGSNVEVAEKSMLWVRFRTVGKQCHASRPELGRNAFLAASHLVVKLSHLTDSFNFSDPLYEPPVSTFQPTRKDANVPNINTIPGDDVFYLDCRVLPRYPLSEVLDAMRKAADDVERTFDVRIEISPVEQVQAPPPTPTDAPVVKALERAIKDIYGVSAEPVGIGGGTVAAPFRQVGFPVAVWSRIDLTAHQPNEFCFIENMLGDAKVYAHLFLQGSD